MSDHSSDDTIEYSGPSGGWGSVRGIVSGFFNDKPSIDALKTLAVQNKPGGVMCVSCSWSKPPDHHPFEFCENGAKATLWELTSARCTPAFFSDHTLTELRTWSDFDLEQQGRLTHPLRYEVATDKYVVCDWDEAFAAIGASLKACEPEEAIFYASGRASLETSYLYALMARLYGCNNLPDSSNMCHETSSVALKKSIGVGFGTVVHDDFAKCDAIFFFGQNTGTNSPRMLHPLKDAVQRGVSIVTFNPLRERGLELFRDPQNPVEMLGLKKSTPISTQYHQVRPGGDIAVMMGMARCIFEADDDAKAHGRRVLDIDFIAQHTDGLQGFEALARKTDWSDIERESGLSHAAITEAADVFINAERVITFYGMGLTQHVRGFENVGMLVNLHLLRGMIGRDGTGISPVRGHSNVQGQRTVGIATKPDDVPLDRFAAQYGFSPPRGEGLDTVTGCEAILAGKVKAFIGLGGNFLRAIPEPTPVEAAWSKLSLTVQVATKLNRSHLFAGKSAYLLPCLGRTEHDEQATGPQAVSMEDTFATIFGSKARARPASEHLHSEVAIVAGIAKATLRENPKVPWDAWTGDYALIRDAIEETYPEFFENFNARLWLRGGFYRGNKARERIWHTKSGKAEFTVPAQLNAVPFADALGRYRLVTLRSNDQFNTTVYGMSDRLRGIEGTRNVLLINPGDITRAGLQKGQAVTLISDAEDGIPREVTGLVVTPYDVPDGCLAGYYPELNPLVPLSHRDVLSHTPAYKSVPVRIVAA